VAEKAGQEGIPVEMVVIADDCALPRTKGITGARGVAGTVLVHKVAGAAAADGKTLAEVAALAKLTSSRMGTLGVALDSVTVPGADKVNNRLDENTIEIGLGIHGEAGMKQSPLLTADELAKEMVATIQAFGRFEGDGGSLSSKIVPLFESGDELVVLVNNLGGTSNFEMSILARSCVGILEKQYNVKVTRLLVGSFMTSFDMHGASITILNVTGQTEMLGYLDAPTSAPAWVKCDVWNSERARPSSVPVPEIVVAEEATAEASLPALNLSVDFESTTKTLLLAVAEKISESEPLLTKYDTIVGDGDCGITMKRGSSEILDRLAKSTIPTNHPVPMFSALADTISASMGGTSGVLLELMFRKMSSTILRSDSVGPTEFAAAFQAGVSAVSLYGGASVGSRTMLDALVPAAAALVDSAGTDLRGAASRARAGADGTAAMKAASAGRSNYLSEDTLEGTPDPGAVAVAIAFEAVADCLEKGS